MTNEYDSLEIEISRSLTNTVSEGPSASAGREEELEVRILQSALGRPRERFIRPFEPAEVDAFMTAWDSLVLPSNGTEARLHKPQNDDCRKLFDAVVPANLRRKLFREDELDSVFKDSNQRSAGSPRSQCRQLLAKKVGERLYAAIFHGKVGETIQQCRVLAEKSTGLRIRLSFGDQEQYIPEVIGLPWELMYSSKEGVFLGYESDLHIVRYLDTETRFPTLSIAPPIKVLVVFSAPKDQHPIGYAKQKLRLQRRMMKYPNVELRFLERATLARLDRHLEKVKPHILHFLGHGGFRSHNGEGILFFQDDSDATRTVTSTELIAQLKNVSTVRLVVLNACVGARMLTQSGQHPFSGVASRLVSSGIPAVLAMQSPISEDAACRLSLTFYAKLGQGYSVDLAVAAARRTMEAKAEDRPSFEWATPILFLHSPHGKLIDIRNDVMPPPKRIVIFNFRDIRREHIDEADLQVDLTSHFDGRRLNAGTDWNTDILEPLVNRLGFDLEDSTPYDLDFAALSSIAFAAGYLLQTKSGNRLKFIQLGENGPSHWDFYSAVPIAAPKWKRLRVRGRRFSWLSSRKPLRRFPWKQSKDVAVVVSISLDVLEGVESYLKSTELNPPRIQHLILADLQGGPDQRAIRNGGHASRLANTLCNALHRFTSNHDIDTLHIFAGAPNAFIFLLGRLSRRFHDIQLYEYGFGRRKSTYTPSIRLSNKQVEKILSGTQENTSQRN